jgi:ribonuclease H / adenosylcobalamin/alpha-ribazole phosphatase
MLLAFTATLALAAPPAASPEKPSSTAVLQVYLVRHGQAFSNLEPEPDLPPDQLDRLTPLGREQAGETGRVLALRKPALILTSPAGRARQTADEIKQAAVSVEVRTEPRVRPLELGRSASGGPGNWDERTAEWKAGRDPVPPGGESLAQLGKRVLQALREEKKRHAGRGIVVVAHSDVIGAFLALVRGEPGAKGYPFVVRNGSVSLVEIGADGKPELVFVNRLPDELPPP